MVNKYKKLAYAKNYIIGYTENKKVYMCVCDSNALAHITYIDTNSQGIKTLRYRQNKLRREYLKNNGICIELCDLSILEEMAKTTIYNRGEVFEKLVTEHYGMIWKKDNNCFKTSADITINGVAYEIKYHKGIFANAKQLGL